MKFRASIKAADGGTRTEEFDLGYDATAVLEAHVRDNVLQPGEELLTVPATPGKAILPAIERIV